eukprot:1243288-Pyramimonas_sp.AAC.1
MIAAEATATLKLRIDKCKLVPLHKPFSPAVKEEIRQALRVHAPFFGGISAVDSLTYLGLVLGPAADAGACRRAPSITFEDGGTQQSSRLSASSAPQHENHDCPPLWLNFV